MAKTKKKTSPKARGKKQTKRDVARTLGAGALRRRPRSQPLPGMEDARIRELDAICESVSENREQKNELRREEADLLKKALVVMRSHGKTSWRFAGVELVRVPGEEKLRVRTSKEKATAETEPDDDPQEDVIAMDAETGETAHGANGAALET